ncbi:MAG: NADPH:quinone oxidoreductase family protein [Methyloligellaceae bacterium]
MRAVVVHEFGAIGSAPVDEIATPEPGAHEVLIDIAAAPANFVDTLVMEGKYQFLPDRPFTPGKGPTGTVAALGKAASRFKVGDRVLAMAEHGGYAEAVCVHEDQCYGLPESLSFEDAASISLAYDTAWFALVEHGRPSPGESVLVLGATGAVGHAALQLAKAKGAKVIAAVSSSSKVRQVLEAGADHTIDLSKPDLRDSLRDQIYAINDGQGVDIIIDPLGGDFFDAAIRALAWRGRLVVVGFAAGRIPTLKMNYLLLKNIEVSGVQISDYRKRMPDAVRACFEDIFELYVQGKISTRPVTFYPLEDYAKALDDIIHRRNSGRAVLRP